MPHETGFASAAILDPAALGRMLSQRTILREGQDARVVIAPRVGRVVLNLRVAGAFTPWIPATNKFLLAASVQEGDAFTTSTLWVVGMHWSIMNDVYQKAIVASPAIQWTATVPATRNENIGNVPYFRFYVVTAEDDADMGAHILYAIE